MTTTPASLDSLAAALKGEPGLWSIAPTPIQKAPAGDAAGTRHGKGEHPAIPSYQDRMRITIAVDAVRLYNLAYDLPAADRNILTSVAEQLYGDANLGTVPEQHLVDHILRHWPMPPPSLWLLRIVNAVCAYKTALMGATLASDPAVVVSKAAVQVAANSVCDWGGDDGPGASVGGGH